MIDPKTGCVTIGKHSVPASLRYTEFLGSELSVLATPVVRNSPWTSYALRLETADLILQFYGEKLAWISVCVHLSDEDPAAGWGAWSSAKESLRKQLHDQLLVGDVGSSNRKFPWGEVDSILDPKTGDASIVARYN